MINWEEFGRSQLARTALNLSQLCRREASDLAFHRKAVARKMTGPHSHRGGHWFDPSIAHQRKTQVRSSQDRPHPQDGAFVLVGVCWSAGLEHATANGRLIRRLADYGRKYTDFAAFIEQEALSTGITLKGKRGPFRRARTRRILNEEEGGAGHET
jgi:hypothetical protein